MNNVSILIDGVDFSFWSQVELTRSIDTVSTCRFTAPFDASQFELRETFRPFTFKPLQVRLNGGTFFTGTMIGVDPRETEDSSEVSVEGYSLPGVLGDCNVPASALPLEFKNSTLKDILIKVCEPFALDTDIRVSTGAVFEKVAFEIDDKPIKTLADLAKQRNVILSDTPSGAVLVWQSVTNSKPVAHFDTRVEGKRQGYSSASSIQPSYNAQDYYSEVTGFAPAKRRKPGSRWTGQNPWLRDRLRPMSFKMDDTEKGDAELAVKARLGRMFANMMTLEINGIPSWEDPSGNLWAPNTMVKVTAPNAMVYSETLFLVRDVNLKQDESSETADLRLVLPGAFSGEIPARLPWDEARDANDPLASFEAVITQ